MLPEQTVCLLRHRKYRCKQRKSHGYIHRRIRESIPGSRWNLRQLQCKPGRSRLHNPGLQWLSLPPSLCRHRYRNPMDPLRHMDLQYRRHRGYGSNERRGCVEAEHSHCVPQPVIRVPLRGPGPFAMGIGHSPHRTVRHPRPCGNRPKIASFSPLDTPNSYRTRVGI